MEQLRRLDIDCNSGDLNSDLLKLYQKTAAYSENIKELIFEITCTHYSYSTVCLRNDSTKRHFSGIQKARIANTIE